MYANPCNSSVNNFSGICHRCDVIMAINLKATASLTNKSQRNVSVLACLCMMARFIEMNLLLMRCDSAFFVCKLITCPWIQSTNERKICSILIESVRTRQISMDTISPCIDCKQNECEQIESNTIESNHVFQLIRWIVQTTCVVI